MPIMNGIEAAKLIKESWAETTIIGLCEVKDTYTIDVFMKAGAGAVASIDQVRSTIRRACPEKTTPAHTF